ncbi:MAG: hypothetical protein VYA34_17035 [Myxococcota bacterium]|nr:hypothetical protein [Myxococcota bacterium]
MARASALQTLVIAHAAPHTKPVVIVLTTGMLAKNLETLRAPSKITHFSARNHISSKNNSISPCSL